MSSTDLIITGHSLGAGVGSVLALMWADPSTSFTLKSSGLPENRLLHAYCFACPPILSLPLCLESRSLITSLIHSYDFVPRLSLGGVRDLRRISLWLAYASSSSNIGTQENCGNILTRSIRFHVGLGSESKRSMEKDWFLALRKTLDAQCENVELFPAGKVYHVFENDEFVSKPPQSVSACRTPKELGTAGAIAEEEEARTGWKLYQVVDLRKDFGQMLFKCKMLKCHMPHM